MLQAFETNRLQVAPPNILSDQDQVDIAAVLVPQVTAHLPPSMAFDPTQSSVQDWIDRQCDEGAKLWCARTAGAIIGLLVMAYPDDTTASIGYLFAPNAWGQGYATELLSGVLNTLHDTDLLSLYGGVELDNPASARVLEKVGFVKDFETADTTMYRYEFKG